MDVWLIIFREVFFVLRKKENILLFYDIFIDFKNFVEIVILWSVEDLLLLESRLMFFFSLGNGK